MGLVFGVLNLSAVVNDLSVKYQIPNTKHLKKLRIDGPSTDEPDQGMRNVDALIGPGGGEVLIFENARKQTHRALSGHPVQRQRRV